MTLFLFFSLSLKFWIIKEKLYAYIYIYFFTLFYLTACSDNCKACVSDSTCNECNTNYKLINGLSCGNAL